jgi:methionyl-tRNA synthetase
MKRRLVTSALPYVNNIPHLGNLIQVLSADVFARFCRSRGYETLYICGTDEYGTATETRAREEGVGPKELCDRYNKIHTDIYQWFDIGFDRFGRTSTPAQTEIVQHIFRKVYENGYITERETQQLYSEKSQMFLADRYVRGICPNCNYEDARGDQCENCGKLLDPSDLVNPRSIVDDSTPVMKKTKHLYINLPAVLPKLQEWMKDAAVEGFWARNAVQMTQAWIRDGLKERAITRDLKWGIPVPLEGFEEKVFYVWFDAPIGYISITMNHTDRWEEWWRNPDDVELYQFIGKDNIPFHTVIFPSSLLGTGETWTLLHHMSSSEYLNYEGGMFSKSRGIGVFGDEVKDTGIPADVWRFYIFYNRPETSDFTFTWDDFQEKTNGELIGNLSNLVNRTLTFLGRFFDGGVEEISTKPDGPMGDFWTKTRSLEAEITQHLERAEIRDAFRKVFALSSHGNRTFQAAEPWKTRKEDPEATKTLLSHLVHLVRDLAILVQPFIPETSRRIAAMLGDPEVSWDRLATSGDLTAIGEPQILFDQLADDQIGELRERFSGSQTDRAKRRRPEIQFAEKVEIRAARILDVERHPKADRLYIEKVDDGSGQDRQIVSGLVPHYEESELRGRTVLLAANLKPAKLRGVLSQGMLLAASEKKGTEETVEVIFADNANPGTRVVLSPEEADDLPSIEPTNRLPEIDIDTFFSVPIHVADGIVKVGETPLACGEELLKTYRVTDGSVG